MSAGQDTLTDLRARAAALTTEVAGLRKGLAQAVVRRGPLLTANLPDTLRRRVTDALRGFKRAAVGELSDLAIVPDWAACADVNDPPENAEPEEDCDDPHDLEEVDAADATPSGEASERGRGRRGRRGKRGGRKHHAAHDGSVDASRAPSD